MKIIATLATVARFVSPEMVYCESHTVTVDGDTVECASWRETLKLARECLRMSKMVRINNSHGEIVLT